MNAHSVTRRIIATSLGLGLSAALAVGALASPAMARTSPRGGTPLDTVDATSPASTTPTLCTPPTLTVSGSTAYSDWYGTGPLVFVDGTGSAPCWANPTVGVTLDRIPELATTGAQYVSIGALTHSAPASDLSFELHPE